MKGLIQPSPGRNRVKVLQRQSEFVALLVLKFYPRAGQDRMKISVHLLRNPCSSQLSTQAHKCHSSQLLQRHFERIHELKNCETCPYCKKQFSRLKVHLETCAMKVFRSERYKIQCQYCERSYLNKQDYNRHVKKVHCDFVM